MVRLYSIALFFVALLLSACPQLPDYALPHINVPGSIQGTSGAGFTYRNLAVDDFQASTLPKRLTAHTGKFQAFSSIQIRLVDDAEITFHSDYYYDQVIWSGRVESMSFEAVMIPDRSWWNPRVSLKKTAYVLQHEQIHFALMELASRELTRQAQQDIDAFFVIDSTYQGAANQIREKINDLIQKKIEEVLKEHTAFDEDTSLYHDPEKQQWWFDTISSRLASP